MRHQNVTIIDRKILRKIQFSHDNLRFYWQSYLYKERHIGQKDLSVEDLLNFSEVGRKLLPKFWQQWKKVNLTAGATSSLIGAKPHLTVGSRMVSICMYVRCFKS